MSFFNELKRRNVFRVGAAYLVVAWLLIQIVDTVGDMLSLPDAVGRTVLLLVAVGFPIALIVSWIYEVTPEGITTQAAVDAGVQTTSGKKLNAVIIGGLVLALVLVVIDAYVLQQPTPNETTAFETRPTDSIDEEITETVVSDTSIAVLPFTNVSSDPEQEYFADGLTDELLNKLARVPDLQVAGRASSFYYKNRNEDLRSIGETLGVANILQGSVRKAGNDVRINAQLVNAENGFQLWSDSFDFELSDVFAVQDQIAEEVTTALQVTLGTGDFSLPGNTRNVLAYDLAMQARFEFTRLSPVNIRRGITLAQEAVEADPDYARGWMILGNAYGAASAFLPQTESREMPALAREARDRAWELAPEMPEVRIAEIDDALGASDVLGSWNLLQEAIENRLISEVEANRLEGHLRMVSGQNDEAIQHLQRARLLDPLEMFNYFNLTLALYHAGRFEEAIEAASTGAALDNTTTLFPVLLRRVYVGQGEYQNAAEASGSLMSANLYVILDDFLARGDSEGGLNALQEIRSSEDYAIVMELPFSSYASQFGDGELAIDMLEGSGMFEGAGARLGQALFDIQMANARKTEKFKALVERLGYVDFWRATGNWGDYCRPLEGSDDFECI